MLDWFYENTFGQILATLAVSMVPVIELRGAIPIGVALGLPPFWAMLASVIGNMLPVPFIILFVRHVFTWLKRRNRRLDRLVGGGAAGYTAARGDTYNPVGRNHCRPDCDRHNLRCYYDFLRLRLHKISMIQNGLFAPEKE